MAEPYRIAKFEVSNAEYAVFLNAVAATDTNALYHTSMGVVFGGITRSGSSGSYSYSAIAGREDMPVNFVSFWDATRFANWLHNGQPTGAQGNSTTEDGAYTLTPTGMANNTIARNIEWRNSSSRARTGGTRLLITRAAERVQGTGAIRRVRTRRPAARRPG